MKLNRGIFIIGFSLVLAAGLFSFTRFSQSATSQYLESDTELSEAGKKKLQRELITPIRHHLGVEKELSVMSRCPSGVSYFLTSVPSEDNEYFSGRVMNYTGCRGKAICVFRLTRDEKTLEVGNVGEDKNLKGEFVSVEEFFNHTDFTALM